MKVILVLLLGCTACAAPKTKIQTKLRGPVLQPSLVQKKRDAGVKNSAQVPRIIINYNENHFECSGKH